MTHGRFDMALVCLPILLAGPVWADVRFTEPPKVSRDGQHFKIEFQASESTDCTVAVLAKDGQVVRHLAAGVLGANAPAPLQKGTLKQTLTWDGKDDLGIPAKGGPFKVRIGLGLRPTLQDFLADNPAALGSVRGLACGPKGELFVFHVFGQLHPNDGTPTCTVFDRAGKYLRTILPFPADLPKERWGPGLKEATGKSTAGGVGSIGLDGNFYSQIFPNMIRRIGPDMKVLRFSGDNTSPRGDLLSPIKGVMRIRGRGITADPQGNIYTLWEDQENYSRGEGFNQLYVHGPDGAVKKARVIDAQIRSLNSVRVDFAGNIYLALGLRPGKDLLPAELKGQVNEGPKDPDAVRGLNSYPLIYGSIAKFGPEGGVIRKDCGGVACNYAFGTVIEVKGAKWLFSGASPVVSWRTPGTPDICNCESPRFDVDGYGRSFFPDAALCRVGILDTNGNLIGWFGTYGNADSAGKGSRVPTPDVPLLWPYCIAAGDDAVFVGDRLNRRVARVSLEHTVVEIHVLR